MILILAHLIPQGLVASSRVGHLGPSVNVRKPFQGFARDQIMDDDYPFDQFEKAQVIDKKFQNVYSKLLKLKILCHFNTQTGY